MRVLVVVPFPFPKPGGNEKQAYLLSKFLLDHGHAIRVVCASPPWMGKHSQYEGIMIDHIDYTGDRGWNKWKFLWRLTMYLRRTREDYDLIHVLGLWEYIWSAALIGRLCGKPVVGVATHQDAWQSAGYFHTTWIYRLMRCLMREWVGAYVALQSSMVETIANAGIESSKVKVIGIAIDTKLYVPSTEEKRRSLRLRFRFPEAPVAAFVGRFNDRKGITLLAQAWIPVSRKFPKAKLLFIGKGPLQEKVQTLLADQGALDAVEFVGETLEVASYYQAVDLYVNASPTEGQSNAVLEAMSCGTPCLVADHSGNLSLIRNNVNGRTFKSEDLEDLIRALTDILGNPAEMRPLAAEARKTAVNLHDVSVIGQEYLGLYQSLMEQRQRSTSERVIGC